jgi:hypothetical protein
LEEEYKALRKRFNILKRLKSNEERKLFDEFREKAAKKIDAQEKVIETLQNANGKFNEELKKLRNLPAGKDDTKAADKKAMKKVETELREVKQRLEDAQKEVSQLQLQLQGVHENAAAAGSSSSTVAPAAPASAAALTILGRVLNCEIVQLPTQAIRLQFKGSDGPEFRLVCELALSTEEDDEDDDLEYSVESCNVDTMPEYLRDTIYFDSENGPRFLQKLLSSVFPA